MRASFAVCFAISPAVCVDTPAMDSPASSNKFPNPPPAKAPSTAPTIGIGIAI